MGAGTIFLILVVLVLVGVAAFVYFSGRSKLQRAKEENAASPHGGDDNPDHVAIAPPDRLEDLGRNQR